jgi:hypothetical protein
MGWKACALIAVCVLSPAVGCQASAHHVETGEEASRSNIPSRQVLKSPDATSQEAIAVLQTAMKNPKLQAAMRQHVHPNATIVSLEDLNRVSQEKFLGAVDEASPGFVAADFNGDGVPDYAALLTFPQKNTSGEWLVVFMGNKDGGFQLRLLEKYNGVHDDIYITMEPPGEVKPFHSARSVKLRAPGIARIHPDRRPTLFYWQKGRFQRLNLSGPQAVASSLPPSH